MQIPGHYGGVRVISEGRGSLLLVGTTKNCILAGNNSLGFEPTAVLGHADELWALAAHPTMQQFVTAGHDKIVQMWDSLSHNILWSKDIGVSNKKILIFIEEMLPFRHNVLYILILKQIGVEFPVTNFCGNFLMRSI